MEILIKTYQVSPQIFKLFVNVFLNKYSISIFMLNIMVIYFSSYTVKIIENMTFLIYLLIGIEIADSFWYGLLWSTKVPIGPIWGSQAPWS